MVDEAQRQRQTPQTSNAMDNYYGWNSSMGRDLRVDPQLPHQFQYRDQGRTVVSDTEPAFTDMGRNRNVPLPQTRTPSNIGYDRMGGRQLGPPSNIGYDRMGGGLGGLQEQAAVDPSDWRTILRILEAGGNPGTETQVAYSPGASYDDDDYGPFVPPSVIEMDLEGIDYDPSDEYDYDRKRGYPGYIYDSPPSYAARGGLMSLRR